MLAIPYHRLMESNPLMGAGRHGGAGFGDGVMCGSGLGSGSGRGLQGYCAGSAVQPLPMGLSVNYDENIFEV